MGRIVKLSNWKCHPLLELSVSQITVLTGVNGGGKTSVLQALLLLKYCYELKKSEHPVSWPRQIGGVNFGPQDSFLRGVTSEAIAELEEEECSSRITVGRSNLLPEIDLGSPFLSQKWRVVSTARLQLSAEQNVEDKHLSDGILDQGHSLVELEKYYNIRRHPSKHLAQLFLKSEVERILSLVTLPTFIDLSLLPVPGKMSMAYEPKDIGGERTVPEQYGAGVTACLPICIHCAAAQTGEVILVQDPEIHLHPRGQSLLGRELAKCALRGVWVILETHSEHVLTGLKLGLIEGNEDVSCFLSCYYLEKIGGEVVGNKVDISRDGFTRKWPAGYFDQAEVDLAEHLRLLRE